MNLAQKKKRRLSVGLKNIPVGDNSNHLFIGIRDRKVFDVFQHHEHERIRDRGRGRDGAQGGGHDLGNRPGHVAYRPDDHLISQIPIGHDARKIALRFPDKDGAAAVVFHHGCSVLNGRMGITGNQFSGKYVFDALVEDLRQFLFRLHGFNDGCCIGFIEHPLAQHVRKIMRKDRIA